MAICRKLRNTRRSLCSGDLDSLIEVQSRSLQAPAPGEMIGIEEFVTIKSVWAFADTVRGTSRFANVNIDDSATHLWYVRYDSDIAGIEVNNNFILYDERLFSILAVTNDGEDNMILVIQTRETGDEDKEAAKA